MRANKRNNNNGITTAANNNEIAAANKISASAFTNEEIKRILFELVTEFDAVTGEYVIAGTAETVEDSILNRLSFVSAIEKLIDAIKDGNDYGVLNSLTTITSKKYESDLGLCVQHLERSTTNNFIKEMPLNDIVFEDNIINIYWKSLTPLMKRAACLILVSIGHLTDRWFEIPCFNYNGDSCNFYGCLDANKFSFFQGRIPGTEMNEN